MSQITKSEIVCYRKNVIGIRMSTCEPHKLLITVCYNSVSIKRVTSKTTLFKYNIIPSGNL